MHPRFLSILCCPESGSVFTLKIETLSTNGSVRTGTLMARDGNSRYPIINGIPRFVDAQFYSGSFGFEWRRWPRVQFESENVGLPMEGHTTRMFTAITGLGNSDLTDDFVVEFGCGPGRFLDIVRQRNGIAVGIDMSIAVESARENFVDDDKVLIVQGDILKPPFKKGTFDHGYTIGVLHHTPEPAKGLRVLAGLVKPGGTVSCCVYPKGGFYDFPSVSLFRKLHGFVADTFGVGSATRLALGYSYCSAYVGYYVLSLIGLFPLAGRRLVSALERRFVVNLPLPDSRWRILDVFDAITPCYASTHIASELHEWFMAAGCCEIRQMNWGETAFMAKTK